MAPPRFEYEIEYNRRQQPVMITLTAAPTLASMGRPSDLAYRAAAARAFQRAVVTGVQRTQPRVSRRTILNEVRGFLQGVNRSNAASHILRTRLRAGDIEESFLDDVMDQIHESNMDVDFMDIEWSFVIDQNTLLFGGAAIKMPAWAPTNDKQTWEKQEFKKQPLNCAAFSLAFLEKTKLENKKFTSCPRAFCKRAWELMQQFHWDDYVNASQLQAYVRAYPTIRLTLLQLGINDQSDFTYTGTDFDGDEKHCFYLIYDGLQHHWAATRSPASLFGKYKNTIYMKFCHTCLLVYNPQLKLCKCADEERREEHAENMRAKRRKYIKCKLCGEYSNGATTCSDCPNMCNFCNATYDDRINHRCIIYNNDTPKQFWKAGDPESDKVKETKYKLWAYDLESAVHRIPEQFTMDFATDEDGGFLQDDGPFDVQVIRKEKVEHRVNMVIFRNVFDPNDEHILFGPNCLEEFMAFMLNTNYGRNICVAHNGSGYDSRLIFDAATKFCGDVEITPTTRGCKFMQVTVGHTVFRDSLLHIRGSLAGLAKDFFGAAAGLRKGHFPHLFNSVEHYTYVGPIPDKSYFDLSFMIKSKDELQAFNDWYDAQKGKTWSFIHELTEYCRNDVLILARLMKEYHTILDDKFGMSPWFHATAPSYVHALVIRKLTQQLELPDKKEKELYRETVAELAWKKHWGVLVPNEYWFARLALRGGRTDVRKVFHTVSQQDWDRGVRIRYQDIVSMYPYVQVAREYPVGLPTIEVYDPDFYPCFDHRNPKDGNVVQLQCGCPILKRRRFTERYSDIRELTAPTVDAILADESFFGFVCATLEPPKDLFHPVLVSWDEDAGKCIGKLNLIEAGVFTSVEFKVALMHGYKLIQLHRLDRYHKAEGLWSDLIKDLYIHKMANAEQTPPQAVQDQLVRDYEAQFGMGDAVRQSFPSWGSNPAKKQTFKILLNSGWGKHAQRPVMPQSMVVDENETDKMFQLFKNLEEGVFFLQDFIPLGNKTFIRHSANGECKYPNLHHGYLPAAVFVPAYGRLMLWEQLHKLGKRVLMHDTDSIVYVYDPQQYNIPEGDVWGQWSVEKFDTKNDGIRTFVGLGPKSYGLEAGNGKTMFKCKGVGIKLAHEKILNFKVMKQMVLDYLREKKITITHVPQMNFVYRPGKKMITWKSLKKVSFQPSMLKGILGEDGILYPYGYQE